MTDQKKRWRRAKAYLTHGVPVIPVAEAEDAVKDLLHKIRNHEWRGVILSPQKVFPNRIRISDSPLTLFFVEMADHIPVRPAMQHQLNPVATVMLRNHCRPEDIRANGQAFANSPQKSLLIFGNAILVAVDHPISVDIMPIGEKVEGEDFGDLITGPLVDCDASYDVAYRDKKWWFVTAMRPQERPRGVSAADWMKVQAKRREDYDRARFNAAFAIPEH
jgi:hypothetical protein